MTTATIPGWVHATSGTAFRAADVAAIEQTTAVEMVVETHDDGNEFSHEKIVDVVQVILESGVMLRLHGTTQDVVVQAVAEALGELGGGPAVDAYERGLVADFDHDGNRIG